jgi:hypothetical protein
MGGGAAIIIWILVFFGIFYFWPSGPSVVSARLTRRW